MPPYKILYITPSVRLFGARVSLLTLVTNLDKNQFEPIVVCPKKGPLSDELTQKGIKTEFIPIKSFRKGKYFPLIPITVYKLLKLVKRENIDLIHCNEDWVNPYAVLVKWFTKIPVVTHMRLSITEKRIKNYLLKYADKIICVSNKSAENFKNWKYKEEKVVTIYNGIDLNIFNENIKGDRIRREFNLTENDILITYIALISPRKMQHITIQSAKEVLKKFPNCKFLIIGEHSPREVDYINGLKEMVRGYEDKIIFTGFRRDIPEICAASDINLLISSDEGFGRVILEAGAMGVLTIGTNIGGIPEVIEDNKTGLLIPPNNSEKLTETILQLIENPTLRQMFGNNARERIRTQFSIQTHTLQIQNLYLSLLKNRNK